MVIKKLNLLINVIELKFRFIYIFFSLIVTFIVCFIFKVELFFIISNLFLQFADGFIYTSLLDPLIIYLKLSFLFTLIIILPIILYILGFFFSKSFYSFYVNYFGIYWCLLYIISFSLFFLFSKLIFPLLLEFLIDFQRSTISGGYALNLQATITQYYSFFFYYLYLFLIIISIPNIYLILIFINIIDKKNFLTIKFRKYLYLLTIFIFLLFAPPDLWIQLLILPFIILILEIYIYLITYLYCLYFSF